MKAMTQENIFDPPFACIGAHLWKLRPKRCQKHVFLVFFGVQKSTVFGGLENAKRGFKIFCDFFSKKSKKAKNAPSILGNP